MMCAGTPDVNVLTNSCFEFSLTGVVWTYDTFENNFRINHKFAKYMKENCGSSSE